MPRPHSQSSSSRQHHVLRRARSNFRAGAAVSVTKPLDGWDHNASRLLRRRIFEGSPDKAVNYSPDWIVATSAEPARPGPLCVQIADILRRHADLWAYNMRREELPSRDEGRSAWLTEMRLADCEIKRLITGHRLSTGHAA